ncbi:MAG: hypothetical protein K8F52_13370 [Candidatus Scalindua rubra]|uniref:4-hydroxy-2-oxo-heptane-1,7-dioate aldolase n=1 Tax=Candidatus Scalindua brodae TaxID=237368 RepID=A0A0B0ED55_9BACT|nr:MAG: 4-hydroxy-2-oxo-heptane-1,7-dioate aldolase [Candidatus Scalindua brodae]MBZ0109649.1 hypothetical protein [Candidatus Scalindua rubra]TWU33096.1 4-hydroxy-2-oxo-heptane-1,7-dioate aldolase [Candidatus Brocadiaceae bacterium S225]
MKKELLIKHRLESDTVVGSWVSLGSVEAAEIIATSGFSFVTIDLEHTGIDIKTAESLIRVIELSGSVPIVRVSENDPIQVKRVMDCGAHGIIVPMVNTPEEAEQAVASIHYPPKGIRGVGLYRAQKYGNGFKEYKEWLLGNSVVVVQIESKEAINNIDNILSVDRVDAAMIGPYDLSNSLGVLGELNHPEVIKAEIIFLRSCMKCGVAPGIHIVHPDREKLEECMKKGFRFIAYGVDMIFLENATRQALSHTRDLKY